MTREVDLAGIVERDARLQISPRGTVIENGPAESHRSAAVDRRDLLTLLRETQEALVTVGECHGCLHYGENAEAEALLVRLAPLLPSADDVRGILA